MSDSTSAPSPLDESAIIDRLKHSRRFRRGPTYEKGSQEGRRWAAEVAAWNEIRLYAAFIEEDVQVTVEDQRWGPSVQFSGDFQAPEEDYGRFSPPDDDGNGQTGAPAFQVAAADADQDPQWITDKYKCEAYWRGWLEGAKSVHELALGKLEPATPANATSGFHQGDWVQHSEFGIGQVVSSSPTFRTQQASDEDLVVRFERSGVKALVASVADLKPLSAEQVESARKALEQSQSAEAGCVRDVDPDDIPF